MCTCNLFENWMSSSREIFNFLKNFSQFRVAFFTLHEANFSILLLSVSVLCCDEEPFLDTDSFLTKGSLISITHQVVAFVVDVSVVVV